MEAILKEADSIEVKTLKDTYPRYAAHIPAVRKTEPLDITTCGTLRIFAGHTGENQVRPEIDKNPEEVKSMDDLLTEIAQTYINEKAALEKGAGRTI